MDLAHGYDHEKVIATIKKGAMRMPVNKVTLPLFRISHDVSVGGDAVCGRASAVVGQTTDVSLNEFAFTLQRREDAEIRKSFP